MNYLVQDAYAGRKKVISRTIIVFLCVMVFLTFFSNTINNFSLPKVETEQIESGTLMKVVTGEGVVKAKETTEIYVDQSMMVQEIKMKAGDKVKKGQTLMVLNRKELEQRLKEQTIVYEQKKIELEKLTDTYASIESIFKRGMVTVGDKIKEMQENFDSVQQLYDVGAESAANLKDAQKNLDNAKKEYDIQKEDGEKRIRDSGRDIKIMQYDIQLMEMELNKVKKSIAMSSVTSPIDGIVSGINYHKGDMTSGSLPVCSIVDMSKGFEFIVTVDKDKAKDVASVDKINVTLESSIEDILDGQLKEVTDNEQYKGEKKDIIIDLPTVDGLAGGERGDVLISIKSKSYSILVPNAAVRDDRNSKYVLILTEKKKPLGNEFYAQRVNVTVDDSDNLNSGILNGLNIDDQVIVKSDKPIAEGSRIMLK
jgi:hypothetical protein